MILKQSLMRLLKKISHVVLKFLKNMSTIRSLTLI